MEKVRYKGYLIEPRVSQLRDGGFGAEVYIEEHTGPSVNIKQFYFENTSRRKRRRESTPWRVGGG